MGKIAYTHCESNENVDFKFFNFCYCTIVAGRISIQCRSSFEYCTNSHEHSYFN